MATYNQNDSVIAVSHDVYMDLSNRIHSTGLPAMAMSKLASDLNDARYYRNSMGDSFKYNECAKIILSLDASDMLDNVRQIDICREIQDDIINSYGVPSGEDFV